VPGPDVVELGPVELREVMLADPDPTCAGAEEATEQLEERGLPGAGGAEQGHHLTGCDVQVHSGERGDVVALRPVDVDQAAGGDR
jgi:hypothetical protein